MPHWLLLLSRDVRYEEASHLQDDPASPAMLPRHTGASAPLPLPQDLHSADRKTLHRSDTASWNAHWAPHSCCFPPGEGREASASRSPEYPPSSDIVPESPVLTRFPQASGNFRFLLPPEQKEGTALRFPAHRFLRRSAEALPARSCDPHPHVSECSIPAAARRNDEEAEEADISQHPADPYCLRLSRNPYHLHGSECHPPVRHPRHEFQDRSAIERAG